MLTLIDRRKEVKNALSIIMLLALTLYYHRC